MLDDDLARSSHFGEECIECMMFRPEWMPLGPPRMFSFWGQEKIEIQMLKVCVICGRPLFAPCGGRVIFKKYVDHSGNGLYGIVGLEGDGDEEGDDAGL